MSEKLKVLDLFSGIGGFSLGLERTGGFKTIAFCEIDNYCQRVLHKHWPEVYIHSDIRTLTAKHFEGRERPDVICGGFPCQDISNAGKCAGIEGERSGLWSEYRRLIFELRPRYAIVENVSALLVRGMGRVLGDLAEGGYDAEWDCIRAFDVGAPHLRDRVWIVAYPDSSRRGESHIQRQFQRGAKVIRACEVVPNPTSRSKQSGSAQSDEWGFQDKAMQSLRHSDNWNVEPNVGRVANGVPSRVDRLRSLGNAIVPQIATWIGERILEAELLSSPATGIPQGNEASEVARKEEKGRL